METYKNSYDRNEDHMLWELHEIRHKLHKELSKKSVEEMNKDALRKFKEWQTKYKANQIE
ncbi:hypothetical protein [Desulfobacterium sp. N47]|uniref:Uncharacterized protein n=1 Tax=uncultured Desulfobacterium sp. TaxID=201089 RepID=E1YB39_9BACT|nr:unknown protein [uncultured Desulfobacterium sp.]